MTTAIPSSCDVAVIGAGPAGLVAATVVARAGLSSVLFDENSTPGGQIYRGVTASPFSQGEVLGADYWAGAKFADDLRTSGAQYVPGATVWLVTRDRQIGVSVGGRGYQVQARHVILATGALERPFPIPGWTLPGVMTAGAAQTLLKSSGIVPEGKTILAGCGPLLWLLAWQYLNAGVKIEAILDTTPAANFATAARHLPSFLASSYFGKGLRLLSGVRRHVRVVSGVSRLEACGDGRLSTVLAAARGKSMRFEADNLFLHHGVVPNTNLANSIGVPHRWDDNQRCFIPEVDADGQTAIEGIAIAGDGAGIAGAEAAEAGGRLAAFAALRALDPARENFAETNAARAALAKARRGRTFLDELYKPAPQFRIPEGDTIACRCEEITAGEVLKAAAMGVPGPNQMKAFLRCGMGPCQGRMCGLTVTELVASARGVSPADVGYYRLRPPLKPITVGELAAWPKDEAAVKAVARG